INRHCRIWKLSRTDREVIAALSLSPNATTVVCLLRREAGPGSMARREAFERTREMQCQANQVFSRRKFISNSSIGLAAAASASLLAGKVAWARPATDETVEVKTAYGRLRGKRQ